jgi:hypothetical protein
VWPQLFGGQCGAARGGLEDCQPLAARNERHHAARTALIRAIGAAIALAAYPIPTGQAPCQGVAVSDRSPRQTMTKKSAEYLKRQPSTPRLSMHLRPRLY